LRLENPGGTFCVAAPSTVAEFLGVAAKSELLEENQLDEYLEQLRKSATPLDAPAPLAALMVRDGLLTRFQADHLLRGKWLGFFLGPYKVLEPIGAGGAGTVYLCEHRHMRRQAAVKVLLRSQAEDPIALERFHREARAASALDHPHIVRAFDLDRQGRMHFLAMEYVDGKSLHDLVKKHGRLQPRRAADYLRQAALGLQHAHEAGLVHRDIKPTNLMVDRHHVVKILDLGLARFFEDVERNLTQGAVLGVIDYIAPEQVLDSHSVDARADIYSLGATFYYCVTGSGPPKAGFPIVPPPGDTGWNAASDLIEMLRRMMAQDPEQRYQTAAEVAQEAARYTQEQATPPPPMAPSDVRANRVDSPQHTAATPPPIPSQQSRQRTPPPALPTTIRCQTPTPAGPPKLADLIGLAAYRRSRGRRPVWTSRPLWWAAAAIVSLAACGLVAVALATM
jgi:serine/threonine protein kinase